MTNMDRDVRVTSLRGERPAQGGANGRVVRSTMVGVAVALASLVTTGDASARLDVPTYAYVIEAGTVSFLVPHGWASTVAGVGVADADRVTVAAWSVSSEGTGASVLTLTVRLAGDRPDTFSTLAVVGADGVVIDVEVGRVTVAPAPLPGRSGVRPVSTRTVGNGAILATVVVRNDGREEAVLSSVSLAPPGVDAVHAVVGAVESGIGGGAAGGAAGDVSIGDATVRDVRLAPGEEAEITLFLAPRFDVASAWLQVDPVVHGNHGHTTWTRILGPRLERRP